MAIFLGQHRLNLELEYLNSPLRKRQYPLHHEPRGSAPERLQKQTVRFTGLQKKSPIASCIELLKPARPDHQSSNRGR